jgi:hypothetical protein
MADLGQSRQGGKVTHDAFRYGVLGATTIYEVGTHPHSTRAIDKVWLVIKE